MMCGSAFKNKGSNDVRYGNGILPSPLDIEAISGTDPVRMTKKFLENLQ